MDSILEKITLYDILGYFFPGSILVIMVLLGGMEQCTLDMMKKWEDNIVVLHLTFILVSYLAGIALSEVSEAIQSGCEWVIKTFKKEQKAEEMLTFFEDQVAEALSRSGENGTKKEIKEKLRGKDNAYYKKYIYGIVQGNQDYKRIHSYASAYVMYKNIAAALLVGSLTLCIGFHVNCRLFAGGIALGVLMIIRSRRFKAKKNQYALIWFMEKYGAKEKPKTGNNSGQ